ncbi:MAG: hypothetical protein M1816_000671 [Peltula sp. TS41687]|nr:MAG: hypothetical protein M1816_000671 [Peltula sp. TS41687]
MSARLLFYQISLGVPTSSAFHIRRDKTIEWHAEKAVLRAVTKQLRSDLNRIVFIENWTFKRLASTAQRRRVLDLDSIEMSADVASQMLQVEQDKATEKLRDLASTIQILRPRTLIRRVRVPMLGWAKDCKPAGTLLELEGSEALELNHIRAHCERIWVPTHWIPFSNDASRILEQVNCRSDPTTQVAIADVRRLDRLKIPWQRSDELVRQRRGSCFSHQNDQGIKFAWPRHYLVYGWVPAQCVVRTFDLQTFRQVCERQGVKEGPSKSYEAHDCVDVGSGDDVVRPPQMLLAHDEGSTPVDDLVSAFQGNHL